MEKYILRSSYWLGIVCLLLALFFRFVNIISPATELIPTRGDAVSFNAFLHGAFLFFGATLATAAYRWVKSETSHGMEITREAGRAK